MAKKENSGKVLRLGLNGAIRIDKILYVSRKDYKESLPEIHVWYEGMSQRFSFSFDTVAERDGYFKDIIKAMEAL